MSWASTRTSTDLVVVGRLASPVASLAAGLDLAIPVLHFALAVGMTHPAGAHLHPCAACSHENAVEMHLLEADAAVHPFQACSVAVEVAHHGRVVGRAADRREIPAPGAAGTAEDREACRGAGTLVLLLDAVAGQGAAVGVEEVPVWVAVRLAPVA